MRIAIEASAFWRDRAGSGTYVRNLLAALEKTAPEHDFLYLAASAQSASAGADVAQKGRLRRVINGLRHMAWLQVSLPLQLRRVGADLLHAPIMIGPFWQPCPAVFTILDLAIIDYPETSDPVWRSYVLLNLRLALARAKAVIAISESTRQDVIRHFSISPDLVRVVPFGCDPRFKPVEDEERRAQVRAHLDLPERYLLFVGTLEPRKNIPRILRAFHLLKGGRSIPHKLVIVGQRGWLYNEIFEEIAALGLEGDVVFTGYVDLQYLPAIYGMSDLLVFPSLYEGFGLPALEAMACGCPVLTSNRSSLPEVVGDAAICVDPTDVGAIAEAITAVVSDPARRTRMAQQGLARSKLFSWERAAEETLAVYSLAAQGSADPAPREA